MVLARLTDAPALERALAAPRMLLFKHSTRCPVSAAAFEELQAFAASRPDVPSAYVDVIDERALSQALAAATGVRHESPQALWMVGGTVRWHASHGSITRAALAAAVGGAAPASGEKRS